MSNKNLSSQSLHSIEEQPELQEETNIRKKYRHKKNTILKQIISNAAPSAFSKMKKSKVLGKNNKQKRLIPATEAFEDEPSFNEGELPSNLFTFTSDNQISDRNNDPLDKDFDINKVKIEEEHSCCQSADQISSEDQELYDQLQQDEEIFGLESVDNADFKAAAGSKIKIARDSTQIKMKALSHFKEGMSHQIMQLIDSSAYEEMQKKKQKPQLLDPTKSIAESDEFNLSQDQPLDMNKSIKRGGEHKAFNNLKQGMSHQIMQLIDTKGYEQMQKTIQIDTGTAIIETEECENSEENQADLSGWEEKEELLIGTRLIKTPSTSSDEEEGDSRSRQYKRQKSTMEKRKENMRINTNISGFNYSISEAHKSYVQKEPKQSKQSINQEEDLQENLEYEELSSPLGFFLDPLKIQLLVSDGEDQMHKRIFGSGHFNNSGNKQLQQQQYQQKGVNFIDQVNESPFQSARSKSYSARSNNLGSNNVGSNRSKETSINRLKNTQQTTSILKKQSQFPSPKQQSTGGKQKSPQFSKTQQPQQQITIQIPPTTQSKFELRTDQMETENYKIYSKGGITTEEAPKIDKFNNKFENSVNQFDIGTENDINNKNSNSVSLQVKSEENQDTQRSDQNQQDQENDEENKENSGGNPVLQVESVYDLYDVDDPQEYEEELSQEKQQQQQETSQNTDENTNPFQKSQGNPFKFTTQLKFVKSEYAMESEMSSQQQKQSVDKQSSSIQNKNSPNFGAKFDYQNNNLDVGKKKSGFYKEIDNEEYSFNPDDKKQKNNELNVEEMLKTLSTNMVVKKVEISEEEQKQIDKQIEESYDNQLVRMVQSSFNLVDVSGYDEVEELVNEENNNLNTSNSKDQQQKLTQSSQKLKESVQQQTVNHQVVIPSKSLKNSEQTPNFKKSQRLQANFKNKGEQLKPLIVSEIQKNGMKDPQQIEEFIEKVLQRVLYEQQKNLGRQDQNITFLPQQSSKFSSEKNQSLQQHPPMEQPNQKINLRITDQLGVLNYDDLNRNNMLLQQVKTMKENETKNIFGSNLNDNVNQKRRLSQPINFKQYGQSNLMKKQGVQNLVQLWDLVIQCLESDNINQAYEYCLDSEDSLYLMRLMALTGPCSNNLTKQTSLRLIRRINQIMNSNMVQKTGLKLFQQAQNNNLFYRSTRQQNKNYLKGLYHIADTSDKQVGPKAVEMYQQLKNYLY